MRKTGMGLESVTPVQISAVEHISLGNSMLVALSLNILNCKIGVPRRTILRIRNHVFMLLDISQAFGKWQL